MSSVLRETLETRIKVVLDPSADEATARISTPDPFLTHMLETLGRYAGWSLDIEATGDLRHHVIEDVAITLGLALSEAVPDACSRYGHAVVPMDDALVEAAVDVGGRPYHAGRLPARLYEQFFRSLADNARATLHLRVIRGRDRHHIIEAAFKALGLALRDALRPGDRVFSTKGGVTIHREPD